MGYSQYSEHRRPTAVPKVDRVQRDDATGRDELRTQKEFERAGEKLAPRAPGKKSFAELLKAPKKK